MNKEILTVVEVVSNEKGVEREIIFQALESAIASATKKRFSEEIDCRVSINREDGSYRAFRRWEIIDLKNVQSPRNNFQTSNRGAQKSSSLKNAQKTNFSPKKRVCTKKDSWPPSRKDPK